MGWHRQGLVESTECRDREISSNNKYGFKEKQLLQVGRILGDSQKLADAHRVMTAKHVRDHDPRTFRFLDTAKCQGVVGTKFLEGQPREGADSGSAEWQQADLLKKAEKRGCFFAHLQSMKKIGGLPSKIIRTRETVMS